MFEKVELKQLEGKGEWLWAFAHSDNSFTETWNEVEVFIGNEAVHSFYEQSGCFFKVIFDMAKNIFTTFTFVAN